MDIPRLDLLGGTSVEVGKLKVRPVRLSEIRDMGEDTYNRYIALMTFDKRMVLPKGQLPPDALKDYTDFELLVEILATDEDAMNDFADAVDLFLGCTVLYTLEGIVLNADGKDYELTQGVFENIKQVVKVQNYFNESEGEQEYKPANSKAEEYKRLIEERRKKMKKDKEKDRLDLSDVISIVATYVDGMNMFNVWDLTVYQLYESYLRLSAWDNFHSSNILRPHMDEDAQKKIEHWAVPMKPNNT